jgi:hypothetical protein
MSKMSAKYVSLVIKQEKNNLQASAAMLMRSPRFWDITQH